MLLNQTPDGLADGLRARWNLFLRSTPILKRVKLGAGQPHLNGSARDGIGMHFVSPHALQKNSMRLGF
jgi:hypothetical protein